MLLQSWQAGVEGGSRCFYLKDKGHFVALHSSFQELHELALQHREASCVPDAFVIGHVITSN